MTIGRCGMGCFLFFRGTTNSPSRWFCFYFLGWTTNYRSRRFLVCLFLGTTDSQSRRFLFFFSWVRRILKVVVSCLGRRILEVVVSCFFFLGNDEFSKSSFLVFFFWGTTDSQSRRFLFFFSWVRRILKVVVSCLGRRILQVVGFGFSLCDDKFSIEYYALLLIDL